MKKVLWVKRYQTASVLEKLFLKEESVQHGKLESCLVFRNATAATSLRGQQPSVLGQDPPPAKGYIVKLMFFFPHSEFDLGKFLKNVKVFKILDQTGSWVCEAVLGCPVSGGEEISVLSTCNPPSPNLALLIEKILLFF